jgi:DNA modification methylase|tara:strand:- start:991 stop:1641 length:651 start_codon:yes stop_codon:yes gene_type:complete
MIYNKDFRDIIKGLDKEKTLIITDPPYNVGWTYDTYKDKVSEEKYLKLFSYFKGFRFVVIHYIEDIIKYIVPNMGVPQKVVQWVYNSNMGKQHRSIAFFNCKPDFNKATQLPKNPTDKRVNSEVKLYDWWLINLVKNVSKEKEDYSNQIPEKVIGNIIKIVANENDIIFEPFMGSGTTPAVASKLGYKYIATDISEKAFNITNKRLSKIENNLFTI